MLNALFDQIHRIRILRSHKTPSRAVVLWGYISYSLNAPQLVSLVDINYRRSYRHPSCLMETFISLPRLERVRLSSCETTWSHLRHIPTLKHLYLHSSSNKSVAHPTMKYVMETLRTLHLLETLAIHCGFSVDGDQSDIAEVSLPNLQKIELSGKLACCVALLSKLSFPSTAYINVGDVTKRLNTDRLNDEGVLQLWLPLIPKLVAADTFGSKALRSIEVVYHPAREEFVLHGWTTERSLRDDSLMPRFSLRAGRKPGFTRKFIKHLPASGVHTLFLTGLHSWYTFVTDLGDAFIHLNSVEELRMVFGDIRSIWSLFTSLVDGKIILPSLRILQVDDLKVYTCSRHCRMIHHTCIHALEPTLRQRQAVRPINRLVLIEPSITSKDGSTLCNILNDVQIIHQYGQDLGDSPRREWEDGDESSDSELEGYDLAPYDRKAKPLVQNWTSEESGYSDDSDDSDAEFDA